MNGKAKFALLLSGIAAASVLSASAVQAQPEGRIIGYYAKGPIFPATDHNLCLTGNAGRQHAEITLLPCVPGGNQHVLQQWGSILVHGTVFICMLAQPHLCIGPGPQDPQIKNARYVWFYKGSLPKEAARSGLFLQESKQLPGLYKIRSATYKTFMAPRLNELSSNMPASFRPALGGGPERFFFWVFPPFEKVEE